MKRIAGIALAIVSGFFVPCKAQGAEEAIALDVALDCRTFKYNRRVPLEQIVPGDGYILTAKVFPAGTLRLGPQANDPDAPDSIGTYVTRGTTNATLAEHIANPNRPGVFETGYLLLNGGGSGLVSNGWFAPGGANRAAITGGWGSFRGANGEMSFVSIGTNSTGCENGRLTIVLVKQAPK